MDVYEQPIKFWRKPFQENYLRKTSKKRRKPRLFQGETRFCSVILVKISLD